jgi:hypothetical protein
VLSSDTVETSFFNLEATGGFAVGVIVDLAAALVEAAAAGGGAYLAVLRCGNISYKISGRKESKS